MATPNSPQNTTLALAPPFVQGATIPVIGAHIGIPLAISNLVPDGLGARVRIDPPQAGTVDPSDTIVLMLKGELAPLDSKLVGNPNAPIEMRIPVGRLNHARVNELYYDIIRNSQNVGSSTPMLEALFNMIRPGLKDVRPDIVGHSELGMTLADEIKNGVGPGFVSAQVCFTYPYCRAYDTITLKCNGEIATFKVGANEAPQPPDPGSAAPTTVCFTVDRAFLDKAIRPSGTLDFSYTATDQYLNTPDPDAVWSTSQTVDENLAGKRFAAMIYRERSNDPNDPSEIIDLELLGKNQLQVIVLTNDPRLLAGDVIDGTYTASAEGKPDIVVPLRGVVEADEFGQKKVVILWVDNDKVIAGSTVKSVYAVLRNGTSIGQSVAAMARVVGEGGPDLLRPRLQKSVAGVLDSLNPSNLKGANGQVEVLGFRGGDEVKLIVEGALGAGSPVFDFKPLNTASRANFPLNSACLAANMGKYLKLRYILRRNGKLYDSQVLDASVKRIADYDPALPVPTINMETGSALDIPKLPQGTKAQVEEWAHQQDDQSGSLKYEGFDKNGVPVVFQDLIDQPLGAGPGLQRDAPLEWFKTLQNKSTVKMIVSVNYDGQPTSRVVLPIREYLINTTEELAIEQKTMMLTGLTVKTNVFPLLRDSPGNTEKRNATGGELPIKYRSLNSNIASVDADGKVTGNSDGDTRIEAEDKTGKVVAYSVSVRNVSQLAINNTPQTFNSAVYWMSQVRGTPVTAAAYNNIIWMYGQWMPIYKHYWLCDQQICGINSRAFFHHEYRSLYCADPNADFAGAWCLIR
ncbi:Ig-like domain-containing protein [Pseudomonas sp. GM25]|uniref:Ig-like domain-containing protein n=1 Tax=Pseudomonas sp. GM25 TaxID=1144327 RepID=UPI00026FE3B5|nr:Ig-like domain-containing protein [Pseudomonas sp. GM25]EJM24589.1 Ig-like domain-containing protein [Pseudomonas sp. GM25]